MSASPDYFVGIDVAKGHLDVCVLPDSPRFPKRFANDDNGARGERAVTSDQAHRDQRRDVQREDGGQEPMAGREVEFFEHATGRQVAPNPDRAQPKRRAIHH